MRFTSAATPDWPLVDAGCRDAREPARFGLVYLLSFLDDEITDALGYHLRQQGVVIRHDETYARVEAGEGGVILTCKSGKKFKTDILLWTNRRAGNTQGLGLEAIGLTPNGRGQLEVNQSYQTALPHIYAVGDVAGPPALASAGYDQGRFVGAHIADGECDWSLVESFPTGIYRVPEISSIGRTERELTAAQVPYEVAHAQFKSIARAQITGHTVGMLKILFHRDSLSFVFRRLPRWTSRGLLSRTGSASVSGH